MLLSLFLFPRYLLVVRNIIMNTFTANNEKETQSLLSQKNEEGETKKKTTSAKKKNVFLTVGGLAAVGILGLASSKSSSSFGGSAAPFTEWKPIRANAIDDSLVRRVLAAGRFIVTAVRTEILERCAVYSFSIRVYRFVVYIPRAIKFSLSEPTTSEKQTKELLDNEIRRVADIFSTLYCYIITFQIIISKQHQ